MNNKKLVELFSTLRNILSYDGRFEKASALIAKRIEESYFFNQSRSICIYNHYNSVILSSLLLNNSNYFRNSFVFPRVEDNNCVSLYHISSPNDLIIDNFGAVDVVSDFFKIDIREIDVILVSGMAFDYNLNVLNIGDNDNLYKLLLNNSSATKIGVCLDCQVYRKSLPESEYKVDGLLTEDGCYFPIDIQEE